MSREYHIRVLDPKQDGNRFEVDTIKDGKVVMTYKCKDTEFISKVIVLTQAQDFLNRGSENE